jgi:hypothetical protein
MLIMLSIYILYVLADELPDLNETYQDCFVEEMK